MGRGHDEVALIFPICIIGHNDHSALLDLGDGVGDGVKSHFAHGRLSILYPIGETRKLEYPKGMRGEGSSDPFAPLAA